MITAIDNILSKVTMYKLVAYALFFELAAAAVLGALGLMPYGPIFILYSAAVIFILAWITNYLFAKVFEAPSNPESTWITALILALIIAPPNTFGDPHYLMLAFWATTWAVASKYILAIKKKHVFNPAAFGVAVTGLALGLSASWWIGTLAMAPFVLLAGLAVVRKLRRFDLWWSFIIVFLGGQLITILTSGRALITTLDQSILYAPVFFFSTIMLTEPLTMPPTRTLRLVYGALVGFLFLPNIHIGVIYLTPELALLLGNIFAYLVSSKDKLVLTLTEARRLSPDVYEFAFAGAEGLAYRSGQYMEWTLGHGGADARGIRRYFTIASAPSEPDFKLGVKFYDPSSTYKKRLLALRPGETVVAASLMGDFTLPKDAKKRLAFIAGGIGSTPFRSMVVDLLARGERRPVTLIYQNKTPADAVYREIFEQAERELGLKYVEVFDRLTPEFIKETVPDYLETAFYVSGPQAFVANYKKMLLDCGLPRRQVKTDYFPGF